MSPLSLRFLALPALALTVIVALANAHSPAGARTGIAPTVERAQACMACTVADAGTTLVR